MTPEAQKLRDKMERTKADYTVLKRQRQKYQQEADRLFDLQKAADEESARKQDAVDASYGLSPAIKKARKDALKRANAKFRAAYKEFSRVIHRRNKAEDAMLELEDELSEARMRLEDLGYKVNPMAAKKAKKKPSAKQLAARRKFAAAAKARSKAAKAKKTAKPRKKNATIIKAKRIEHLDVSKIHSLGKVENPKRRRNVTSASDLVHVGEAKAATRDGVKGWMVARKFFPRSATPKTARLTSGAMLDLKYGDVWKLKRKGNPKYLVTGTKTTRKVEDLGILDDKSATAAIARARKLYKGHTNVKARRKNISQGFYDSNGIFHPIRAASDYDGKTAGETGGKPRRTRSKKRAASARKASQTARQKAATKQRKATTTRLATRSLQRSYPLKGKRRNPESATTQKAREQFKGFHGYESRAANDLNLAYPAGHMPVGPGVLGEFILFKFTNGGSAKPQLGKAYLVRDVKGKLHLGIDKTALARSGGKMTHLPKGKINTITSVEYIARKPHLGDPHKTIYFHEAGEENGILPSLYSDGDGGLLIKGGDYYITPEGIRN